MAAVNAFDNAYYQQQRSLGATAGVSATTPLDTQPVTKATWGPSNELGQYQAHGSATYKSDLFAVKAIAQTPWVSEVTHAHSSPSEWAGRTREMTIVHTGGGTDMAMVTHHTDQRPKICPGSIRMGTFTTHRYDAHVDPAVTELHEVVDVVKPRMEDLAQSLSKYHLHSPDGWIESAGFLTCCNKIGLRLTRDQFLALERSVPKDNRGRINYLHVLDVVSSVSAATAEGDTISTAPECVTTRLTQSAALVGPGQ